MILPLSVAVLSGFAAFTAHHAKPKSKSLTPFPQLGEIQPAILYPEKQIMMCQVFQT